jgi:hypothetical protein
LEDQTWGDLKMSFWDRVKNLNKMTFDKTMLEGYHFNKILFNGSILIIFLWLLAAGFLSGWSWSSIYFHCDGPSKCENPFYTPEAWIPCSLPVCYELVCDKEFFMPGESFGRPPSFFMIHAQNFVMGLLVVVILINHFVYNRGYFKKRQKELEGDDDGDGFQDQGLD